MAIVGSAQIRISPNTTGFGEAMRRSLEGTRGVAANAGRQAGADFAREFQSAFDTQMRGMETRMAKLGKQIDKAVADNLGPEIQRASDSAFSDVERRADKSGDTSGKSWASRFKSGFSKGFLDLDNAFRDSERTAARAGDNSGRSFSDRFGKVVGSSVGASAKAASKSFTLSSEASRRWPPGCSYSVSRRRRLPRA